MPFLRHSSHSSSRKDHKISKVDVTTIRVGSGDGISMLSAPREVVQATRAYIAQMPGEISFNKGDFFHVVSRGPGGQIQIRDPVRGISGSASMAHFRFFEKPHRTHTSTGNGSRTSSTGNGRVSGSGSVGLNIGRGSSGSISLGSAGSSFPNSHANSHIQSTSSGLSSFSNGSRHVSPLPSLYGVVLYDFHAERPDELSVNAGDSLILCAHHHYEWFIGKFLNKIGEPGLVPVSYVQLYDVASKQAYPESSKKVIDRIQLPTVEHWKEVKNRHKASARPVGVAAVAAAAGRPGSNPGGYGPPNAGGSVSAGSGGSRVNSSAANSAFSGLSGYSAASAGVNPSVPDQRNLVSSASLASSGPTMLSETTMVSADSPTAASRALPMAGADMLGAGVDRAAQTTLYAKEVGIESFSVTNGKYWFLVRVVLADGSTRCLCRYYEDFFNLHQRVLAEWPHEGGRYDTKKHKRRIIPFIPGPVMDVSETLCHRRMVDLDVYLSSMRELPAYISRSVLVNSFYDLWPGDQQLSRNDVTTNNAPIRPARSPPNMVILNGSNASASAAEKAQETPETPQPYFPRKAAGSSASVGNSNADDGAGDDHASIHSRAESLVSRLSELALGHRRQSSASSVVHHKHSVGSHLGLFGKTEDKSEETQRRPSSISLKLKLKFYYKDDIFAIAVPTEVTLEELKQMIIPRIDECKEPNIIQRLKVIPKNVNNVDQFEYLNEDILRTDEQLHGTPNFVDKGKFLVLV